MILRSNKKWVYESPEIKLAGLALEALICDSVRFNVQVNELENKNDPTDPIKDYNGESFYFES